MSKRKITPEWRKQQKKPLVLLQGMVINDVVGVQELFKEMVSTVVCKVELSHADRRYKRLNFLNVCEKNLLNIGIITAEIGGSVLRV